MVCVLVRARIRLLTAMYILSLCYHKCGARGVHLATQTQTYEILMPMVKMGRVTFVGYQLFMLIMFCLKQQKLSGDSSTKLLVICTKTN